MFVIYELFQRRTSENLLGGTINCMGATRGGFYVCTFHIWLDVA